MINPFKSKKFVYASATFAASLIVALLPTLAARVGFMLEPKTIEMVYNLSYIVAGLGFMTIGGHQAMDMLTTYTGKQMVGIAGAVQGLGEAIVAEMPEWMAELAPTSEKEPDTSVVGGAAH